jgi:large subunit ribosomal protein L3
VYVRTLERDGYCALQVGAGEPKLSRVSKPEKARFAACGVAPKKFICEFRVSPDEVLEAGHILLPSHFKLGQFVDVRGRSKSAPSLALIPEKVSALLLLPEAHNNHLSPEF